MKKRLFFLKMIEVATAFPIILLFLSYLYIVWMMTWGEINLFIAAAAIGGVIAACKAMFRFMTELEDMIERLERAIERKRERERADASKLRNRKYIRKSA